MPLKLPTPGTKFATFLSMRIIQILGLVLALTSVFAGCGSAAISCPDGFADNGGGSCIKASVGNAGNGGHCTLYNTDGSCR